MMSSKPNVQTLLTSNEFQKLSGRFNQFCPFEATGMVRAEIRHGSFMAYMLDPRKPHGFGSRLLQAFLEAALHLNANDARKLVERNEGHVQIRREWRDIDLMIILGVSKQVVVVELKIDAFQSAHQLATYREIVEVNWLPAEGWQSTFLFLTKRGELSNDNWTDLRLKALMTKFDVVAAEERSAPALEYLRYYLSMMRRHHVGDDLTEELARKLWAQHGEALDFLVRHRPMPIREMFLALKDRASEVAAAASNTDMTVVEEEHSTSIIRFGIQEWDKIRGFKSADDWTTSRRLILLEIKFDASGIDAYAYIAQSENSARARILSNLFKSKLISKSAAESDGWASLISAEIFRPTDVYGFEREEALAAVGLAFAQFAARVFDRFDPVLRPA